MTQAAQSGPGGLPPLEYSDCFLDSPTFREVIVLYEKEMESNYYLVKNLVRQCETMIQATKGLPMIHNLCSPPFRPTLAMVLLNRIDIIGH